jgi:predicted ATPase
MASVEVRLFGGIDVSLDGGRVTGFRSDKVRALLAYLALEAGCVPVRRETLVELLWDGFAPGSAAHSLRSALYDLRRLLGASALLRADRRTVWLDFSRSGFFCDVLRFESLLSGLGGASPPLSPAADAAAGVLSEAQALYRGEFLAGFKLPDSPRFDAWQQAQRQKHALRAQFLTDALQRYSQPPGNLPRLLPPFFGRTAELDLLARKVLDPDYPLITVVGEGGVGKSRLALALAQRIRQHFPDGVWFVPLTDVAPPAAPDDTAGRLLLAESLAAAIGDALSVACRPGPARWQQVFDHLRSRRLLLILDNFEHLVTGRAFVVDLLERAPEVVVLITSRHRLGLQAEYVLTLEGLPVPELGFKWPARSGIPAAVSRSDDLCSVSLFRERAERTGCGFKLDTSNHQDVIRICRLAEGLPLAIELAAGLTGRQSCAQIADSIATSFDLLATTLPDVPVRHRSLRAVFEHSWRLLSDCEATALARCSVFQGGFSADAAWAVCDAAPDTLAGLTAKSLLVRTEYDRHVMHALMRQFAAERLARDGVSCAAVLDRHCRFFIDFLAGLGECSGDDPCPYQAALADMDNLRAAWNRAVSDLRPSRLAMAARGLSQLYYQIGLLQEAENIFGQAAERLRERPEAVCQGALAQVLLEQSNFAERLGRPEAAARMASEAIRIGESIGGAHLQAGGHLRLAEILWGLGHYPDACGLMERGLALARAANDRRLEILGLVGLGLELDRRGEHARAIAVHEVALDLAQASAQRRLAGVIAANLGKIWEARGDFARAKALFAQALQVQLEIADRLGTALTQSALGRVALMFGDTGGAQEQLTAALTTLEEFGERLHRCEVLVSMALLRQRQGDLTRAFEIGQQAVELAQAAHLHGGLIEAMLAQGHVLAVLGRVREAHDRYAQVAELAAEMRHDGLDAPARAGMADLYLAAGELADALAEVERILPALPALPLSILADPFQVYLTCHRVLAAAGDARALDVAQAAQARLRSLADQITDPALRWRFLEQVPSHRSAMMLSAARS